MGGTGAGGELLVVGFGVVDGNIDARRFEEMKTIDVVDTVDTDCDTLAETDETDEPDNDIVDTDCDKLVALEDVEELPNAADPDRDTLVEMDKTEELFNEPVACEGFVVDPEMLALVDCRAQAACRLRNSAYPRR